MWKEERRKERWRKKTINGRTEPRARGIIHLATGAQDLQLLPLASVAKAEEEEWRRRDDLESQIEETRGYH